MSNKTRKGIRPGYLAAALGVVAMLAMLAVVMLPSGSAEAQSPFPHLPKDVTAAADNATQVTVTWTLDEKVAPPTGYEVERRDESGTAGFVSPAEAHAGTAMRYVDNDVSRA